MLSRRNIRVKVMQTLYSVEAMGTQSGDPQKILIKKIENTQELLTYISRFLLDVCLYAEKYAMQKAHKHLPTESDLSVNTKIAGNQIVWEILENVSFQKAEEKFKTKFLIDEDQVKRSFLALIESPEYKAYNAQATRKREGEREILEYILENLMLSNDSFCSDGEERFIHWNDDMDTEVALIKTVLKKGSSVDFLEMPDKEKMDFAKELLSTVIEKNDYCLDLIKPKLQNWEAERIAVVDMVLLKMGLCELLYFDTIPTKVTLNEYIDIAKEYSTPKSGHFVNGILDNLLKDLEEQEKIHKTKFNKTAN